MDVLDSGESMEDLLFSQTTWDRPVLIRNKTGLDVLIPDADSFHLDTVMELVGS